MPLYNTEAINLKSSRFGEADKLMTFFTKSHGKVTGIAKSAFKPTSKFGGRLEIFAYNHILLAKGKNIDIISQAETIETFYTVRQDERGRQAGMYMAKVLYFFLEDRVKDEALFDILIDCLYMLKSGISPDIVTRVFDVRFSDAEGVLPIKDFSNDVVPCVKDLREGNYDAGRFAGIDLKMLDSVLVPLISDHIGKDIRTWKNL